jgi:hypothetical protein
MKDGRVVVPVDVKSVSRFVESNAFSTGCP